MYDVEHRILTADAARRQYALVEVEDEPHADLVGFTYHGSYRGRWDYTIVVTGVAPWNAAYVNVRVTRADGTFVGLSSRRVEHVRMVKEQGQG